MRAVETVTEMATYIREVLTTLRHGQGLREQENARKSEKTLWRNRHGHDLE